MNNKYYIILLILIISIGLSIKYLFNNQITNELLIIIFTLIIIFFGLIIIFDKGSLIKESHWVQIITLTLAFIGTAIWFIGEILVYFGKAEHPLLDTIGSAGATIGSLLALILYIRSIK